MFYCYRTPPLKMVELVSEFTPVISHVYKTSRKLQLIVGRDGKQWGPSVFECNVI